MKADRRADLHNLYQAGELFGFEGKNDLGGVAVIAVLESTLHGKDAIIYAIPLLESNLAVGSAVEDVVATGGEVIMEASCGHVPDTYERRGIGEVDEEGIFIDNSIYQSIPKKNSFPDKIEEKQNLNNMYINMNNKSKIKNRNNNENN